jgi:hypothetical protein
MEKSFDNDFFHGAFDGEIAGNSVFQGLFFRVVFKKMTIDV